MGHCRFATTGQEAGFGGFFDVGGLGIGQRLGRIGAAGGDLQQRAPQHALGDAKGRVLAPGTYAFSHRNRRRFTIAGSVGVRGTEACNRSVRSSSIL